MDDQNLDAEYDLAVSDIQHNLTFLENELDMMVLSTWIARLSEPAPTLKEKLKRNEYINYLAYMLKREMIHEPFVDVPPEGELPPLNISMPDSSCPRESQQLSQTPPQTPMRGGEPRRMVDERSPMAASTPNPMEAQRHQQWAPQQAQPEEERMAEQWAQPQEDRCKKPAKVLAEARGEESPSRACHVRKEPTVSPPGYLQYSSEKDTKPFLQPMPGSDESEGRMKHILKSVDGCTRLSDFIRHVAPETCDQGGVLNYVATGEIAAFKEFVQIIYRSRMKDTEELLGKEQMKLKKRYEEWTQIVLTRAFKGLMSLKQLLPDFKYDLYKKEPEYLYNMIRTQFMVDEKDLHPQVRVLRIKAQKKRWLADEAERIEKENEDKMVELKDLNDQLSSLSKCYNTTHKSYRRKNSGLEEKVAALRIKYHQNQKLIDALIDELNEIPAQY